MAANDLPCWWRGVQAHRRGWSNGRRAMFCSRRSGDGSRPGSRCCRRIESEKAWRGAAAWNAVRRQELGGSFTVPERRACVLSLVDSALAARSPRYDDALHQLVIEPGQIRVWFRCRSTSLRRSGKPGSRALPPTAMPTSGRCGCPQRSRPVPQPVNSGNSAYLLARLCARSRSCHRSLAGRAGPRNGRGGGVADAVGASASQRLTRMRLAV